MPILGSPGDMVSAYTMPNRPLSGPRILLIIVGLFILKNILFNDYRSEEISLLKGFGQTEEQIEALVPKTASERRKKQTDSVKDFEQMKEDIEFLKDEVKKLRGNAGKESAGEDKGSRTDEDSSSTTTKA